MWNWILDNKDWIFSGAGIAVLAAVAGLARHLRTRGPAERERQGEPQDVDFRFFAGPREAQYNHDFYNHFTDRIAKARANIYITGDGFECADDEGRQFARRFNDAFRQALRRQVQIVRIQTRSEAHREWANMLAELMREFPNQFQLYLLRVGKAAQMSSVCVIDPEFDHHCVVEIMLSTQKLFGARAADLAGTAVFIERSQSLALDLRQRILSLTTPELALNPQSPDDAIGILAGRELYFAFGSNMSEEQMVKRAPSAVRQGVAFLPDHELVFNRRGSYRPGGVASIAPKKGSRVYGVIYSLSGSDLAALDGAEDPEAYRRVSREVVALDGSQFSCEVYEAIPEGEFAPDRQYVELLVKAAAEASLPETYIEHLRSLQSSA